MSRAVQKVCSGNFFDTVTEPVFDLRKLALHWTKHDFQSRYRASLNTTTSVFFKLSNSSDIFVVLRSSLKEEGKRIASSIQSNSDNS